MSRARVYLGSANSLAERVRVYRTGHGLEIDRLGYSDVERQRIPFAEILLVTLHPRTGGLRAWLAGGLAALFAILAAVLAADADLLPWLLYVFAGLAFLFGLLAGLLFVLPTWTVTIYGKRALARLVYRLREGRARAVYGEIGRLADEARLAVPSPAEPPPPPLPPPFGLPPAEEESPWRPDGGSSQAGLP